jgi:thiamine biosynthesis lipoprotein
VIGQLVCVAGLSTVAEDLPQTGWEGETMGSVYTVRISGTNLPPGKQEALKQEVEERLREINRQMSHYIPESELSRFNRVPAGEPFRISAEFAQVMRLAEDLNLRSRGAFDPTLGPLINLWGFGEREVQMNVPSAESLRDALRLTGFKHLRLNARNELVKEIPGLHLNLSAIAKGFGVDAMAAVLRRHGFKNLYASISGEVYASGHNRRGTPWQVGISTPLLNWREGDPVETVLSITGRAVSTSGDYQRYFVSPEGRRLCHILDPRTGQPVQHNLASVTVVADSGALADGLSTTLFVLGADEGLKCIEGFTNAAALFLIRENATSFRQVRSSRFTAFTGNP